MQPQTRPGLPDPTPHSPGEPAGTLTHNQGARACFGKPRNLGGGWCLSRNVGGPESRPTRSQNVSEPRRSFPSGHHRDSSVPIPTARPPRATNSGPIKALGVSSKFWGPGPTRCLCYREDPSHRRLGLGGAKPREWLWQGPPNAPRPRRLWKRRGSRRLRAAPTTPRVPKTDSLGLRDSAWLRLSEGGAPKPNDPVARWLLGYSGDNQETLNKYAKPADSRATNQDKHKQKARASP